MEESKMKLTKSKLKQIIQEELKSALSETWPDAVASGAEGEQLELPLGDVPDVPPSQLKQLVLMLLKKLKGSPDMDPMQLGMRMEDKQKHSD